VFGIDTPLDEVVEFVQAAVDRRRASVR